MTLEQQLELKNRIQEALENLNDDTDNAILEKAQHYYCSLWDIREGMKHAINLTLDDQYDNHADEQDGEDLQKLAKILQVEL